MMTTPDPGAGLTVAQVLARARAAGVDRLDAQLLLARHLDCTRSWLLAHDDAPISPDRQGPLWADLHRRAGGEPLAYLLGEREFHGLRLAVSPAVLVPRPDTELLVDWALQCLHGLAQPRVADLGTGSGAIAVSVAHCRSDAVVTATDVSADALAVARTNADRHAPQVQLVQGSWWQAVRGQRFDLVLSNPPYIAGADAHLAALTHEPRLALTPGGDGLDALRAIVREAPDHLQPGAWLLLEHGWDQAAAVRQLLAEAGLNEVQTRQDLAGQDRCSGGRRAALPPLAPQAGDGAPGMPFAV